MNIQTDREQMIFRKDYNGKTFYSIGLSKKVGNEYENGYMNCSFKKDVVLENQTKIKIKSAWLTFYKNKDNHTIPYIFINEFIEGQAPELSQAEIIKSAMNEESDPFSEFKLENEEELDNLDLPF